MHVAISHLQIHLPDHSHIGNLHVVSHQERASGWYGGWSGKYSHPFYSRQQYGIMDKSHYSLTEERSLWFTICIILLWYKQHFLNCYNNPFVQVMLRTDFTYRADRLIPCGVIIYTVTSTSPWCGLSALELLNRSQLRLWVYSTIESPKYFKAKLTRYCS